MIPVTIFSGFLGSGKTTLLNHLLTETKDKKIACIVNGFSKLNIDKDLIVNEQENIVEMSNGCICCTLRDDLLKALQNIAKRKDINYVIIESTGIGEPLPIAQTFYMEDLPDLYKLDAIVTVVDAANFWPIYNRKDRIDLGNGQREDSSLAPLLVEQIEFTNIIILNKVDIAHEKDVGALESYCKNLNPSAQIIKTKKGQINPNTVLNVGLFDYEDGMTAEKWEAEWRQSSSEVEDYGFNNYVFKSKAAFSRKLFNKNLNNWPDNILRAKGYIKFNNNKGAFISSAGAEIEIQEFELREEDQDMPTELVFIGIRVDQQEIDKLMKDTTDLKK